MSRGRGARNAAIEVFGDRWSLLVLRDILFADRRYFRELQAGSQEGIASNILADRAITERSRAPERGLPRCYQLLVAARQSTMSRAPTDAA
jgi:DNA-binding HxlR family transcriptional regulator